MRGQAPSYSSCKHQGKMVTTSSCSFAIFDQGFPTFAAVIQSKIRYV